MARPDEYTPADELQELLAENQAPVPDPEPTAEPIDTRKEIIHLVELPNGIMSALNGNQVTLCFWRKSSEMVGIRMERTCPGGKRFWQLMSVDDEFLEILEGKIRDVRLTLNTKDEVG